jgi:hypothetical protein
MMEDVNGLNEASQTLPDSANSPGHALIACPTEGSVGTTAWQDAIDHGFFIIFDLAMGGNYPDGECDCTAPTSATTSGASMSVQYVAVYEEPA